MKRFLFFACLGCMLIGLVSCEKKDKADSAQAGSIYGIVTDKATGEPIRSASVELLPASLKAITGDDGHFEFTNIETGTYQLYVTKTGYKDYTSNNIAVEIKANSKSHSIQIEKLPPALIIVDDNRKEINEIDFGEVEGDVMRSFNIFNNGEEQLDWQIVYASTWISALSLQNGNLKPNATQSIVITINRDKLELGGNSTVLHIVSNNGSKQLTILASRINMVETLNPSNITNNSALLNGQLNSTRDVIEYGFVYGKMPTPSLQDGNKVSVSGTPQTGEYSIGINGLTHGDTYYFRSYVSMSTKTYYGETKSFVAELPPYITLDEYNLMVQRSDLGCQTKGYATSMCASSAVGGYSDWRLPTNDEILILYSLKEQIGGFCTTEENDQRSWDKTVWMIYSGYWTSEERQGYPLYLDFTSGHIAVDIYDDQYYVCCSFRAVRTIK